ncbi:MAG: hypothetical protein CL902_00955 [Dehalococcoidia bacterium]|nr:hypothetical protein [Dehalococcoidia bacterium]
MRLGLLAASVRSLRGSGVSCVDLELECEDLAGAFIAEWWRSVRRRSVEVRYLVGVFAQDDNGVRLLYHAEPRFFRCRLRAADSLRAVPGLPDFLADRRRFFGSEPVGQRMFVEKDFHTSFPDMKTSVGDFSRRYTPGSGVLRVELAEMVFP